MPLRLDLFRHGDADPAGPDGDAFRPLSEKGRRDVARVAEEYARRGWRPDQVFASPLGRARETAEILLAHLGGDLRAGTLRALVPDHSPEELLDALSRLELSRHVVLIGHQPLLGLLAGVLTGSELPFPPGGVTSIELDGVMAAGGGRLLERIWPADLD